MLRSIFLVLAIAACGDNKHVPGDAAPTPDAAPDASARGPCIDRTTDLPRPPKAGESLPCDMLPPGLTP